VPVKLEIILIQFAVTCCGCGVVVDLFVGSGIVVTTAMQGESYRLEPVGSKRFRFRFRWMPK